MSRPLSRSASNSGSAADRLRPLVDEAGSDVAERLLQLRVGERLPRVLLEGLRGDFHQPASPIAGASVMPASTSATWRVFTGAALALQLAGHVHQAAEVAGKQRGRAGRGDRFGLLLDDGVGDVGILDAERAAEAAAHIGVLQFDQLQSGDRFQEPPRLVADGKLAQARAGVVIGHRAGEGGVDRRHAAHIDQKADQFEHLGGKRHRAILPSRVVGEQLGVVHLQHPGARAGRRHDVVVRLERRDHLTGDGSRVLAVAGVVGRLPAAGLRRRHLDAAARRLDQLHRGKADARPEQVDQAGDEQADARPPLGVSALGFSAVSPLARLRFDGRPPVRRHAARTIFGLSEAATARYGGICQQLPCLSPTHGSLPPATRSSPGSRRFWARAASSPPRTSAAPTRPTR